MNKLFIALILVSSSLSAALPLINKVKVSHNRVDIKVNKEFKKKYLNEDFFVEYDNDINLEQFDYSVVTLPFIMNVISLVWISGKDYEIDEMATDVYESLQTIKDVFKLFYPNTSWTGRLLPKKLVKHTFIPTSDSVALLFSGGVDSTTTSLYHRDENQLLITAWGQSCLPLNEPKLWQEILERITSFAKKHGHKTTFLKSNYYYFLNFSALKNLSPDITSWRMDAIEDIGWAGLIAPIMLSKGINTLRIASSENWEIPYVCASNPYIDSNLNFMGLKFYHDLFSMSRYDKIAYLTDQSNKPTLITCQREGNIINCGSCEKCVLTLSLLLGVHADPRDYGYTLSPQKAAHTISSHIRDKKSYSISALWEYTNLQQKLAQTPHDLLSFLTKIDFSKKIVYDLNKWDDAIDWEELHRRYPHVKMETT